MKNHRDCEKSWGLDLQSVFFDRRTCPRGFCGYKEYNNEKRNIGRTI